MSDIQRSTSKLTSSRIGDGSKSGPLISILSPVNNESLFIAEMVNSVLNQSYRNWELLIVDDGSTDDTWVQINALSQSDVRIKIVGDNRKKGKVAAFNLAFEAAKGDAIILLGGDDTLPESSIEVRANAIGTLLTAKSVIYFRLLTMSDDPKFDNVVIPKRIKGNRSGGTMVMSRRLALEAFPIPVDLVAEDIWLSSFSELVADTIDGRGEVVLNYRIHANNSNPRHLDFDRMNESIHVRMAPFGHLLERLGSRLNQQQLDGLVSKISLEEARYRGNMLKIILTSGRPITEKVRALAMSHRILFSLRTKFFRLLSGWS